MAGSLVTQFGLWGLLAIVGFELDGFGIKRANLLGLMERTSLFSYTEARKGGKRGG